MKKIASFLLIMFFAVGFAFSQNSSGGSNYYSSLFGDEIAPLSASGGSALVWVDMAFEADGVVSGLTNLGYVVTVATGAGDFNTKIQSGLYNMVVLFSQDWSSSGQGISLSAVSNYISGGGAMIYATWTTSDQSFANLFEANITVNTNMTTVTISDPGLASGISNPFTVSNAGTWGIFSVGLSAIGSGEVLATFENSDAAIIRGNGGQTIMLGYLSDAPPSAQRQAIFENVVNATTPNVVPIPYYWIIILFVMIAATILFTQRKRIFHHA
ncbi:MAG: hypothetical protein JW798_08460 [Prolixibacteraceae bacterium]|nr:hypothetical protein [Prolixibacteraceae bacterium]